MIFNNNILKEHPIDSVIITSTSENPSKKFGGTWELSDKQLKRKYYGSSIGTAVTVADSNVVDSLSTGLTVEGHVLYFTVNVTLKKDFSDSNVSIGYLDFSKFGITRLSEAGYVLGFGDDSNAVASMTIGMSNGALTLTDVIPKSDGGVIKAGTKVTFQCVLMTSSAYLVDEFCDKFYWKRVA